MDDIFIIRVIRSFVEDWQHPKITRSFKYKIRIVLAKLIIKTQRLLFVRFGTIIHNDFFLQQFRGKQYYSFPACVDTSDMHKRSKNYNK